LEVLSKEIKLKGCIFEGINLIKQKYNYVLALILFSFSLPFCNAQKVSSLTAQKQEETAKKEHVPNSWDKVSALYLPSLVAKEEQQKKYIHLQAPQQSKDKKPDLGDLQKFTIPKQSEKLEKALAQSQTDCICQVLAHLALQEPATQMHEETSMVCDDTTYRDLNVFCGKEESLTTNLFTLIDCTQTVAGRAALLDMLYNPLVDIQALTERQICIRHLVEDAHLYAAIQEKLKTIKDTERILFLMLNEMSFEIISSMLDRFYLKSVFDLPVLSFITSFPLVGLIRLFDNLEVMKNFNAYACGKLNTKQALLEISRFQQYVNEAIVAPMTFPAGAAFLGYKAYTNALAGNYFKAASYSSGAIGTLFASWFVAKQLFASVADNIKTENMLHATMGELAHMVKALKEMQKIVAQHPELSRLVPFKDFEKEAQQAKSELKGLLTLLDDKNFEQPATWKTPKGKMMAALKFLCTIKYDLVLPYLEAGKIDALMSTASLYNKQVAHPRARYYFAQYEQSLEPHIAFNDFWNPFINPDIVVTNSLELGTKTNYRNILITGPNAGGKSTALKAMAIAVLLAQTLTVANAHLAITPFTKVFSTLNITDTVGKESLYQADKNRIKQVTKTLEQLNPDQKALLISDEMFNSTGASYGAALFYGTLNYLDCILKNTLFVAATHFETLVELEEDTHGSVANFRVEEAHLGSDGRLTWTYKLLLGINKQNISFELAQEDGFDPHILEAGTKLLKRHLPSEAVA
jgi:DNA mismatch repair protein MutS